MIKILKGANAVFPRLEGLKGGFPAVGARRRGSTRGGPAVEGDDSAGWGNSGRIDAAATIRACTSILTMVVLGGDPQELAVIGKGCLGCLLGGRWKLLGSALLFYRANVRKMQGQNGKINPFLGKINRWLRGY